MKPPRGVHLAAKGHVVVEVSCQCGTIWLHSGFVDEHPQRCSRCRTPFHRGARRTLGARGRL